MYTAERREAIGERRCLQRKKGQCKSPRENLKCISAAAAATAIIIDNYYHQDGTAYYGDGLNAKHVRFILETARAKLFREITGWERGKLLENGQYNNSMWQTAVKFDQGLYNTN
ncbi:hypothetical protein VP01_1037g8 [Puccinia sorghi]|uniref:Uncharacterized protein n=1 Tax=Puccinia sorghi TaxID=27349 RepID=A0A0L6VUU9_9BASI|nr:hypothetical protein VP01_1037g8 [Puccinia sorghi]